MMSKESRRAIAKRFSSQNGYGHTQVTFVHTHTHTHGSCPARGAAGDRRARQSWCCQYHSKGCPGPPCARAASLRAALRPFRCRRPGVRPGRRANGRSGGHAAQMVGRSFGRARFASSGGRAVAHFVRRLDGWASSRSHRRSDRRVRRPTIGRSVCRSCRWSEQRVQALVRV